jgi:outer membrane receptor protein involved in Fe transport
MKTTRATTFGTVALLLVLAAGAQAQDDPAAAEGTEGPVQMEDTVVVSDRLEHTRRDSTTSVAVFDTGELRDRTDRSLRNLLERSAGVSTAGDNSLSIRGISLNGPSSFGAPLISVYVDGAVLPWRSVGDGPLSTWDLEQVDILRGPQSTNTGRNALAGAVVLRSRDPEFAWDATARVGAAEYGGFEGAVAGGGPIIDGQLAFRIACEYTRSDGYTTNPVRKEDDYGRVRFGLIRGKLRLEPKFLPDYRSILGVTYTDRHQGDQRVEGSDPSARINLNNEEAFQEVRSLIFTWDQRYDLRDDLELASVTTYGDSRFEGRDDEDDGPEDDGFRTRNDDDITITQELRLHYRRPWLDGVLGFYYANQDEDRRNLTMDTSFPPLPADLVRVTIFTDQRRKINNYALFGEADCEIFEGLTLTAGLRWDFEDQRNISASGLASVSTPIPPLQGIVDWINGFLPIGGGFDEKESYSVLLPKAGIRYRFKSGTTVGFTAQRGYRAGGFSVRTSTGEVVPFHPEFTWTYEASVRAEIGATGIFVAGNAFYTDWKDQQVTTDDRDFVIENAGESHLYGGEVELRGTLAGIDLYGSVGWVRTRFDEFESTDGDFSGNEFPYAPEWTASAGALYRHSSGLFGSFDVSYTDKSFNRADNNPSEIIPDRVIANLKLGYEGDWWAAYVHGTNLTDDDFIVQRLRDGALAVLGPPRVFGGYVEVFF